MLFRSFLPLSPWSSDNGNQNACNVITNIEGTINDIPVTNISINGQTSGIRVYYIPAHPGVNPSDNKAFLNIKHDQSSISTITKVKEIPADKRTSTDNDKIDSENKDIFTYAGKKYIMIDVTFKTKESKDNEIMRKEYYLIEESAYICYVNKATNVSSQMMIRGLNDLKIN